MVIEGGSPIVECRGAIGKNSYAKRIGADMIASVTGNPLKFMNSIGYETLNLQLACLIRHP